MSDKQQFVDAQLESCVSELTARLMIFFPFQSEEKREVVRNILSQAFMRGALCGSEATHLMAQEEIGKAFERMRRDQKL